MTIDPSVLATARPVIGALAQLQALARRYPLATARLWHRDDPSCSSQRLAFTEKLAEDLHYVRGGQGSGKTEGAAQVVVAQARGRRDPEVQAWARANGFPLDRIARDPRLVLAVAPTHPIGRTVHRPLLAKYLPAGTEYQYWDANAEAVATLPNGCVLRCMASNQGRKQFDAMNAAFAWVDEQTPEDVIDAIIQRTARNADGWILLTATPITAMVDPAMAWIFQRFGIHMSEGYSQASIRGLDNPYIPRAARERLLARMSEAERAMAETGAFYNPGGLVYFRFKAERNVIKPQPIPANWLRTSALDIGTSAPWAYLATAYDPDLDQIHVYGGHYARELTEAEHVSHIRQVHADLGDTTIPPILVDANTPDSVVTLARIQEAGPEIRLQPAIKEFLSGVAATNERLTSREHARVKGDRPGLVIHDTLALGPLIREISTLSWDPKRILRDGHVSTSTRGQDHACDALRYVCIDHWRRQRG